MTSKMVPLSARVSTGDMEFIAGLHMEGATTPSDKIRALIAQERQRREGSDDYALASASVRDILLPAVHRLRTAECALNIHSELVARLAEALPDICGFLLAQAPDATAEVATLREFENGLAERTFGLIDAVLRMGVTRRCRCYDPKLLGERLEPTLELAELLLRTRTVENTGERP